MNMCIQYVVSAMVAVQQAMLKIKTIFEETQSFILIFLLQIVSDQRMKILTTLYAEWYNGNLKALMDNIIIERSFIIL